MWLSLAFLLSMRIAPDDPAVTYKQPQIAVAKDLIALTYGAGNSVYFSSSRDQGKTFSKPLKVGAVTILPLGMHRGPRIAIAGEAIVISAVSATTRGKDGDIVAWRSVDGGRTWSPPRKVTDVAGSAREGLHGMAAGSDGTLFLTWLDLRTNSMKLYGSISTDGGSTWSANKLVYQSPDGHICECCHPSAYVGPKGELYAMWRNWLSGSRDMYLAVSDDKGATWKTQKLGQGTWPLKACPMDGGGLVLDARGRIHTTWRRADTVFYAEAGSPEKALGKGKNPSIAVNAQGPYIAWSEGMALKLKKPGAPAPEVLGEGAYVVLAGSGPVYAAWEDRGAIQVKRLD